MLTLPDAIVALLFPFATLFTTPTWRKAQLLLVGTILAPGQRTVAAALRVMGLSDDRNYARYHELDFTQNSKRAMDVRTLGQHGVRQEPEGF